jgi:hypothetical protein
MLRKQSQKEIQMCCSLDRLFETLYAYRENPDDPSAQLDARCLAKRLQPEARWRKTWNDQRDAEFLERIDADREREWLEEHVI